MQPAKVTIAGPGLRVDNAVSHPPGLLYSGGYDAEKNELYLSSVMGHPRGVAAAGGEPSNESVSGLRVLVVDDGTAYWATDSMSLPRGLNAVESTAVQKGLERHFHDQDVNRVEKLEDIPHNRC
jgi:hypothetical protein